MPDTARESSTSWIGPAELAVGGVLLLGLLALLVSTFVPSGEVRRATAALESWHVAAEALASDEGELPTWVHYDTTRPELFAPETDVEGHVPLADVDVPPTTPGEVGLLYVTVEHNMRWQLVAAVDDDLASAVGSAALRGKGVRGGIAQRVQAMSEHGREVVAWDTFGGGPFEITLSLTVDGRESTRIWSMPSTTCIDRRCEVPVDLRELYGTPPTGQDVAVSFTVDGAAVGSNGMSFEMEAPAP